MPPRHLPPGQRRPRSVPAASLMVLPLLLALAATARAQLTIGGGPDFVIDIDAASPEIAVLTAAASVLSVGSTNGLFTGASVDLSSASSITFTGNVEELHVDSFLVSSAAVLHIDMPDTSLVWASAQQHVFSESVGMHARKIALRGPSLDMEFLGSNNVLNSTGETLELTGGVLLLLNAPTTLHLRGSSSFEAGVHLRNAQVWALQDGGNVVVEGYGDRCGVHIAETVGVGALDDLGRMENTLIVVRGFASPAAVDLVPAYGVILNGTASLARRAGMSSYGGASVTIKGETIGSMDGGGGVYVELVEYYSDGTLAVEGFGSDTANSTGAAGVRLVDSVLKSDGALDVSGDMREGGGIELGGVIVEASVVQSNGGGITLKGLTGPGCSSLECTGVFVDELSILLGEFVVLDGLAYGMVDGTGIPYGVKVHTASISANVTVLNITGRAYQLSTLSGPGDRAPTATGVYVHLNSDWLIQDQLIRITGYAEGGVITGRFARGTGGGVMFFFIAPSFMDPVPELTLSGSSELHVNGSGVNNLPRKSPLYRGLGFIMSNIIVLDTSTLVFHGECPGAAGIHWMGQGNPYFFASANATIELWGSSTECVPSPGSAAGIEGETCGGLTWVTSGEDMFFVGDWDGTYATGSVSLYGTANRPDAAAIYMANSATIHISNLPRFSIEGAGRCYAPGVTSSRTTWDIQNVGDMFWYGSASPCPGFVVGESRHYPQTAISLGSLFVDGVRTFHMEGEDSTDQPAILFQFGDVSVQNTDSVYIASRGTNERGCKIVNSTGVVRDGAICALSLSVTNCTSVELYGSSSGVDLFGLELPPTVSFERIDHIDLVGVGLDSDAGGVWWSEDNEVSFVECPVVRVNGSTSGVGAGIRLVADFLLDGSSLEFNAISHSSARAFDARVRNSPWEMMAGSSMAIRATSYNSSADVLYMDLNSYQAYGVELYDSSLDIQVQALGANASPDFAAEIIGQHPYLERSEVTINVHVPNGSNGLNFNVYTRRSSMDLFDASTMNMSVSCGAPAPLSINDTALQFYCRSSEVTDSVVNIHASGPGMGVLVRGPLYAIEGLVRVYAESTTDRVGLALVDGSEIYSDTGGAWEVDAYSLSGPTALFVGQYSYIWADIDAQGYLRTYGGVPFGAGGSVAPAVIRGDPGAFDYEADAEYAPMSVGESSRFEWECYSFTGVCSDTVDSGHQFPVDVYDFGAPNATLIIGEHTIFAARMNTVVGPDSFIQLNSPLTLDSALNITDTDSTTVIEFLAPVTAPGSFDMLFAVDTTLAGLSVGSFTCVPVAPMTLLSGTYALSEPGAVFQPCGKVTFSGDVNIEPGMVLSDEPEVSAGSALSFTSLIVEDTAVGVASDGVISVQGTLYIAGTSPRTIQADTLVVSGAIVSEADVLYIVCANCSIRNITASGSVVLSGVELLKRSISYRDVGAALDTPPRPARSPDAFPITSPQVLTLVSVANNFTIVDILVELAGSITAATVVVDANSALTGSGTIDADIVVLAGGFLVVEECFAVSGSVTVLPGGTLRFGIAGGGDTPCVHHGQLQVGGDVTVAMAAQVEVDSVDLEFGAYPERVLIVVSSALTGSQTLNGTVLSGMPTDGLLLTVNDDSGAVANDVAIVRAPIASTPSPSPSPSSSPVPSPSPSPTVSPSPSPTVSPSPSPTVSLVPSPSPAPSNVLSPSPSPSPERASLSSPDVTPAATIPPQLTQAPVPSIGPIPLPPDVGLVSPESQSNAPDDALEHPGPALAPAPLRNDSMDMGASLHEIVLQGDDGTLFIIETGLDLVDPQTGSANTPGNAGSGNIPANAPGTTPGNTPTNPPTPAPDDGPGPSSTPTLAPGSTSGSSPTPIPSPGAANVPADVSTLSNRPSGGSLGFPNVTLPTIPVDESSTISMLKVTALGPDGDALPFWLESRPGFKVLTQVLELDENNVAVHTLVVVGPDGVPVTYSTSVAANGRDIFFDAIPFRITRGSAKVTMGAVYPVEERERLDRLLPLRVAIDPGNEIILVETRVSSNGLQNTAVLHSFRRRCEVDMLLFALSDGKRIRAEWSVDTSTETGVAEFTFFFEGVGKELIYDPTINMAVLFSGGGGGGSEPFYKSVVLWLSVGTFLLVVIAMAGFAVAARRIRPLREFLFSSAGKGRLQKLRAERRKREMAAAAGTSV
eukprot:TRINITY_DN9195_c0_g1_i1.p1 TRINITY_DN9195_c0_g1~~TRINITY_DN9195_c0_g1_i1.p1  ORF type:complete len:2184 (-),score=363.08 TRINITY_DN9195_c0_g1_i1:139-6630(-)